MSDATSAATHTIAVIGGTGPQGKGLAYRFAKHGHTVVIGSRAAEKAEPVAQEIVDRVPGAQVSGASNPDAVAQADIVLLAVPYDGHDELVETLELAGKIVISCVNPLTFGPGGPVGRPVDGGEGSAAESAQRLAPESKVVGAFHHVAALSLWSEEEYLHHDDVLVCGDDAEAKELVKQLASTVTSHVGVDAGKLRIARQLEPWTAVLININKAYKTRSGIKITGL